MECARLAAAFGVAESEAISGGPITERLPVAEQVGRNPPEVSRREGRKRGRIGAMLQPVGAQGEPQKDAFEESLLSEG